MNTRSMIRCVAVGIVAACSMQVSAGIVSGLKGKMDSFTGGVHSRLVWTQEWGQKLAGYDTEADAMHIICTGQEILRPVFTSGGRRVVFSDQGSTYVVNWDGSGKTLVAEHPCSDAWTDPSTGVDYVYVQTAWGADEFGDCYKINIDDPSDKTFLLHSRFGNGDMSWYQVSSDGRLAVDYLPWGGGSAGGGYVIKDGGYKESTDRQLIGGGCWSTVEKSTNHILINLQCCPHRGGDVTRFHYDKRGNAMEEQIGKFTLPGDIPADLDQGEWMLPKFASKGERVLCVVGGYGGSPKGHGRDCYIQRFTESYTDFEAWLEFTDGDYPNQWPDSWIGVEQPAPAIGIDVRELTFVADEGGANPPAQTVAVNPTSGSLENVTVESDASWLQVSWDGSHITTTVNAAGLDARIHMGRVTVSASNASPRQTSYIVYFKVMGTPVPDFIAVTPFYGIVDTMSSISFSAVVQDQYGNPMPNQPSSFEWKNEGWRTRSFDPETATLYTSESGGIKPIKCTATLDGVTLSEKGYALVIKNYNDAGAQPPLDEGIKINCGGDAVDDWASDAAYVASGKEGAVMSIEGTTNTGGVHEPAPAGVYGSARHGDHGYSFPSVSNGTHTVRFHFSDPTGAATAMGFVIENKAGLSNLNIAEKTSGPLNAYVEDVRVDVTDGNGLQIDCFKGTGADVFVSGIEVNPGLPDYYIGVTAPADGQSFEVGQTAEIRWEVGAEIGGVVIEVSPDNGRNWVQLIEGGDLTPGTTSYPWTIPADIEGVSMISDNVRVKIYDYVELDAVAVSAQSFSITEGTAIDARGAARPRTAAIGMDGARIQVRSAEAARRLVEVYRIDGRAVVRSWTRADGTLSIPVKQLGAGAFFVRLHEPAGVITRAIMLTASMHRQN